MFIWCCSCNENVSAVLVTGREIYPHRPDLSELPFWLCIRCKNYVGCHHKMKNRTKPLGNIPTPELRAARQAIHAIVDPLWKARLMTRGLVYGKLSIALGRKYHAAHLRTLEEAEKVRLAAIELRGQA